MPNVPLLFKMGILTPPQKSKDRIDVQCTKCGHVKKTVFIEHQRACERQSKYVDAYLCRSCLTTNNAYKNKVSKSRFTDEWREVCREKSKKLWKDMSYRNKIMSSLRKLSDNEDFKKKVSIAIKNKFKYDSDYAQKIKKARLNYPPRKQLTKKEFISRSRKIHGDKYDYSMVDLSEPARESFVNIVCPKHGEFKQRALWHCNYGNGCPKCATIISKPHQEIINFIKSIYQGEIIINDRERIKLELDILLPRLNFAIEYHGSWYHSHNNPHDKLLHKIKADESHKVGINLLQIFEYDWKIAIKKKILFGIIRNKLGLCEKIYARNCELKEIKNKKEIQEFLDENHLYGNKWFSCAYGLYYNNNLVICITFTKLKNGWEIARLVTKIGIVVVGGVSKIFKTFVEENSPQTIRSYADRAISNGNIYIKLGFKFDKITKPGYKYYKSGKVFSRQMFQKHKLEKKLRNFDPSKTETQNMLSNGYRIIRDAGHNKYVWSKNENN